MNRKYFPILLLSFLCPHRLPALDLDPRPEESYVSAVWIAQDILVAGETAYVAGGFGGLQFLDIVNPSNPKWMGSYDSSGLAQAVELSGNFLFLVDTDSYGQGDVLNKGEGVLIFDISHPGNYEPVGVFQPIGNPQCLAVSGSYLFLIERSRWDEVTQSSLGGGLLVIDISNHANPQQVGSFEIGSEGILDIAVNGNYGYLTIGGGQLAVIDVADPADLQLIATMDFDDNIYELTFVGNYAYAAMWWDGLRVFDISQADSPASIGSISLTSVAIGVSVSGNTAFVRTQDEGIKLVDVSDPTNPQLVGDLDSRSSTVTADDHYVYTAYASALEVIDYSNASDPQIVGGFAAPFDPRDMIVTKEGYACIADGVAGLVLFDLRGERSPEWIGSYFIGAPAESVAILENYALVAADNTLHVIDISTPYEPTAVGSYISEGKLREVAVADELAYLAEHPRWDGIKDVGGGLRVINLSSPSQPQLVGSFGEGMFANSVAVSGGYAYLADGDNFETGVIGEGLIILDVRNPEEPQRVGTYASGGDARGVAVLARHAYLTARGRYDGQDYIGGGLHVIDIGDAAQPQQLGKYGSSSFHFSEHVWVDGNHAFVLEWGSTLGWGAGSYIRALEIIDISDATTLRQVGRYSGHVRAVAVDSNSVWVAEVSFFDHIHTRITTSASVLQIGVNNPANGQRASETDLGHRISDLEFANELIFVSLGGAGVQVFDFTDPEFPQRVSLYQAADSIFRFALSGNYLYAAVGACGLEVIDISDPANFDRVGSIDTSSFAHDVEVHGDYAYLACGDSGLEIIDVSDPMNPQRVGGYVSEEYTRRVIVSGDFAYLTGNDPGFLTVDVSNPADPRMVASYETTDHAYDLAVSDGYIYSASGAAGLEVIDISDPMSPRRLGHYDTKGVAVRLALSGNYIYLMDADGGGFDNFGGEGLVVLNIEDPTHPVRVGGNSSIRSPNTISTANGMVFVQIHFALILLHQYQPIRFDNLMQEENGAVRLTMTGPPGVPGRVQRSSDPRMWRDWRSVDFRETPTEITDPEAATSPTWFYRLVVP